MRTVKFIRYIIISAIILVFVIITASGGYYPSIPEISEDEDAQAGQGEEAEALTAVAGNTNRSWIYYKHSSAAEEYENTNWARIYLEYLADGVESKYTETINSYDFYFYSFSLDKYGYSGLALIYVNDDYIPELVLYGATEACGSMILTVSKDSEVQELRLNRLEFCYDERGNLFDNQSGHHGYFFDLFYCIDSDGKWKPLLEGWYCDEAILQTDDDFNCTWDGSNVSIEEYYEIREDYINLDACISWYDIEYLELEEMRALLIEIDAGQDNMSIVDEIYLAERKLKGNPITDEGLGRDYTPARDKLLTVLINNKLSSGQMGADDLLDNGTRITE